MAYKPFFTEYSGSPALLSEKFGATNKSPMYIYIWLKNFAEASYFPLKNGFWLLGASYNFSLMNAANDVEYGEHSFYEQSLKTGKICKRG